ncbi:phage head closure protein [Bacillus vallismortis]|uniref:Phage head closure protein n=1 Tax=Bacillus vallismortis TaxID=72361 RepID=A0AAP3CIV4_BACVA|nr:phage head closure protein [Bacillus vallismortis]MCY8315775.1 phage head closure protein [Bacillus vallismortis]
MNWSDSYKDLFTVWGAVEGAGSLRNNETMIAGALGVKSPKKITIRFRKDIKQDMRIIERFPKDKTERIFDILDFNDPKDREEELEILCQEVGING